MAQEFSVNYSDMLQEILTKEGTVSQCFNTFHNYSVNNQFLAYWQLKAKGLQVSPINCFSNWNKMGRKIKKGEKALWLWMPLGGGVRKEVDENGEEHIYQTPVRFGFKNRWFALSQTDGEEVKAEELKLPNFDFNKVYNFYGIKIIPFEKINGNVQGYARTLERELAINPLAEEPEMTILHEVAHIALNHCEAKYGNDLKELEAEAVAYIVGSVLKLSEEQLSHSRGYIQGWFKGNEVPADSAKRIMKVANKIIDLGYDGKQKK